MEQSKRVPYGISNFVDIIERNQYMLDKTMYLPLLEKEADALFFIRPTRFGKSLLISMMRAYYDISMTERFQELFGNLWSTAPILPHSRANSKYYTLTSRR